jgi:predicted aspartyl protease
MNIKTISISQESLEKDNLEWNSAKKVINKIFFKTNIQINVYKHLNKFKIFQTILQQNEQLLTSYFNPEVDIFNKQTNQILAVTQFSNKIDIKFKHHQIMNSRCIIETKINDFSIDALVDTGADFCYLREEICKELNLVIEKYDCDVIVGNNQKLEVLGKICLNITISNYNYPVTCTVVKTLSNPLILGWMGFSNNNNGIINAKDGILTLNKPTSKLSSFAFIEEQLILQQLTENLVTVQLHETTSSDLTFVNKYEPLFKKAGVTIMPGIHEGKKDNNYGNQRKLKMIITNLSSKPD